MNRISELNGLQYHPFRNDANTAVPAYGIIKITGINTTEGMTSLTGAQPDANTGGYAVNGPCEVAAGKYGQCTLTGLCVFQYDTGTPAVNEFYSAKSGQWTANKTGGLIRCLGIIDSTNKFALGIFNGGNNFDVRWNATDHKLEKSTDNGSTWTEIDEAVTCT